MSNNLKILIGATIGGALGWFVGAVVSDYIQLKNEQPPWEDDMDYDDQEYPEGDEVDEELDDEDQDKETYQRPTKMPKQKVKNYTQHFIKSTQPELAALVAKYNGEEEEPKVLENHDEDEWEVREEEVTASEPKDIRVITLAEYAANEEFATVMLNYYDDDVVTDERDNPIDRPERILGDDALVSFGVGSDDEDTVYICNTPKKVMYEVVRTNKDYAVPEKRARREPLSRRRSEREEENAEEQDT